MFWLNSYTKSQKIQILRIRSTIAPLGCGAIVLLSSDEFSILVLSTPHIYIFYQINILKKDKYSKIKWYRMMGMLRGFIIIDN